MDLAVAVVGGFMKARPDTQVSLREPPMSSDMAAVVPRAGRVFMVSNRLPVTIVRSRDGLEVQPSAGGLASALMANHEANLGLWIGWPGELPEDGVNTRKVFADLRRRRLAPVALPPELVEPFYHGFCNSTLWPLFHYFVQYAVLDRACWDAYRQVNQLFARAVERSWRPGDVVWVHDYHLMLLPELLRARLPKAPIGFFLHTPFPSAELFRILPWRQQLLRGVLGSDLVGFHTYDYLRHFRITSSKVLGVEAESDRIHVAGRLVTLGAFPVGVDAGRFARAVTADREVAAETDRLGEELAGRRLILGVDRMDYTKGIPERLLGYERFLERHPRFHGEVEFIQLGVPTRGGAPHYRALRQRVEEIVGRVSGRFGTPEWTPVKYLYRPISFPRLAALYRAAHVALVTPLRDGMNLVAKEFVACKEGGGDGVLILSEFAGAAAELAEALLVNPFDPDDLAAAIHRALTMSAEERRSRLAGLLERTRRAEARPWASAFVTALERAASGAHALPGACLGRSANELRAGLARRPSPRAVARLRRHLAADCGTSGARSPRSAAARAPALARRPRRRRGCGGQRPRPPHAGALAGCVADHSGGGAWPLAPTDGPRMGRPAGGEESRLAGPRL
jgi:trehalose 6-phosphate synthase/phosphatase